MKKTEEAIRAAARAAPSRGEALLWESYGARRQARRIARSWGLCLFVLGAAIATALILSVGSGVAPLPAISIPTSDLLSAAHGMQDRGEAIGSFADRIVSLVHPTHESKDRLILACVVVGRAKFKSSRREWLAAVLDHPQIEARRSAALWIRQSDPDWWKDDAVASKIRELGESKKKGPEE